MHATQAEGPCGAAHLDPRQGASRKQTVEVVSAGIGMACGGVQLRCSAVRTVDRKPSLPQTAMGPTRNREQFPGSSSSFPTRRAMRVRDVLPLPNMPEHLKRSSVLEASDPHLNHNYSDTGRVQGGSLRPWAGPMLHACCARQALRLNNEVLAIATGMLDGALQYGHCVGLN